MSTNTKEYTKQSKREIPVSFTFISGANPITIVHKLYGPGKNEEVFTQLQRDGLLIPTLGQHLSYALLARRDPEDPELEEMNKIMRERYLHSGTDVHSFPGNITFYHDITHLDQRLKNPTQKELEDRLSSRESREVVYSDDGTLRRVQGRYPVGELEWGTLGTNPHIVGMTGSEEVAEEANELASLHAYSPSLWLIQEVRESMTTFSALGSDWYLGSGGGLFLNGVNYNVSRGGFAFGVQKKTGEASRA